MKMNNKTIYWGGVKVDLSLPAEDVERYIIAANCLTPNSIAIKGANVNADKNGVDITIMRDLQYNLQGNVLMDYDCSIMFGLEPACFGIDPIGKFKQSYAEKGVPVPVIPVPIPYAGNWYVGIDEVKTTYQKLYKMATGVDIKDITVVPTDKELKVSFKF